MSEEQRGCTVRLDFLIQGTYFHSWIRFPCTKSPIVPVNRLNGKRLLLLRISVSLHSCLQLKISPGPKHVRAYVV